MMPMDVDLSRITSQQLRSIDSGDCRLIHRGWPKALAPTNLTRVGNHLNQQRLAGTASQL
jgi:hypothetical protein